jgi:hypothetical protein
MKLTAVQGYFAMSLGGEEKKKKKKEEGEGGERDDA